MNVLFLAGLLVACVVMWKRIAALEARIADLEFARHDLPVRERAPATATVPDVPYQAKAAAERIPARIRPRAPEILPPPEAESPEPVDALPPPPSPFTPQPEEILAEVEPEASAEPAPAPRRIDFEELFGRRLPVWAGGITLIVAGFLIVKLSIDAGLLTPFVRVLGGLLFGGGLIAGAEVMRRTETGRQAPRIGQALAGAGIATLYASVLMAANLYHLIGSGTAFAGLVATTILAGGLSLRFGAPSAILGLIGGLAAPALVGSESANAPLLAAYLALAVGGLCALGRMQRWWWLGATAIAGGFGWGAILLATAALDITTALSIGGLIVVLGIGLPLLLIGDEGRILRGVAGLLGCGQMAALVAMGGYTPLVWAQYGLLSLALLWLARRSPELRHLPGAGLAIALMLATVWPDPSAALFLAVLAGLSAIYGGWAMLRLWRTDAGGIEAIEAAAVAGGIALLPLLHFHADWAASVLAAFALAGAGFAGVAAALGWKYAERHQDARFALLSVAGAAMLVVAMALLLPGALVAPGIAVLGAALLLFGGYAQDRRIEQASHVFAGAGALLLLVTGSGGTELVRAVGQTVHIALAEAMARWLITALAAAAFVLRSPYRAAGDAAQLMAVAFAYVALAQPVPAPWMALVATMLLVATALLTRYRPLLPAIAAAAALVMGWALEPLAEWLTPAVLALAGIPFYRALLPDLFDVGVRLAVPAVAAGLLAQRIAPGRIRSAVQAIAFAVGVIVVHSAYKQVFAIDDADGLRNLGMAERTLWEAALAGIAFAAWRIGQRGVALGFGAAGFAHLMWFTLLLHNPLWTAELAGPWLAIAYAIGFALLWLGGRILPGAGYGRQRDWVRMLLIPLFALSMLRQIFSGSALTVAGVGQSEDILRSILAIGIAIGFLRWGISRGLRDWRLASLALMLGAVGKVFLFDAAGLDGLLRIGSFAALGFSLIGVGWLYSRYLPDSAQTQG